MRPAYREHRNRICSSKGSEISGEGGAERVEEPEMVVERKDTMYL